MTGAQRPRRVVRVRHRGSHLKGPRRAKPRGRPQAPDACASLRQSPAPPQIIPLRSTQRDPAAEACPRARTRPPAPQKASTDHMHGPPGAVQSLCRPSAPSSVDQRFSNLEEKLAQALDFSSADARPSRGCAIAVSFTASITARVKVPDRATWMSNLHHAAASQGHAFPQRATEIAGGTLAFSSVDAPSVRTQKWDLNSLAAFAG